MNATDTAKYSAALRRFFDATGTTAQDLADRSGVHMIDVVDAVRGLRLPRPEQRALIADAIRATREERGLA